MALLYTNTAKNKDHSTQCGILDSSVANENGENKNNNLEGVFSNISDALLENKATQSGNFYGPFKKKYFWKLNLKNSSSLPTKKYVGVPRSSNLQPPPGDGRLQRR